MNENLSLRQYLDAVASAAPTPGGGSVAAFTAALASALGSMVTEITSTSSPDPNLQVLATDCVAHRARFLELAEADERAFQEVMIALRLPKELPDRAVQLEAALDHAAAVPLDVAQTCQRLLISLQQLQAAASRHCVSDVAAAALLALASARASLLNVYINASFMRKAASRKAWSQAADTVEGQVQRLSDQIVSCVLDRIRPS